jgi:hypothetical protein
VPPKDKKPNIETTAFLYQIYEKKLAIAQVFWPNFQRFLDYFASMPGFFLFC